MKKHLILLPAQAAACLLFGFIAARSRLFSTGLYLALLWGLLPVFGTLSAYFVTVKGVNNYIAWTPPPFMAVLGHYLAFFYLPSAFGAYLLIAVLSVIGAATGDVVKKSGKSGGKNG